MATLIIIDYLHVLPGHVLAPLLQFVARSIKYKISPWGERKAPKAPDTQTNLI